MANKRQYTTVAITIIKITWSASSKNKSGKQKGTGFKFRATIFELLMTLKKCGFGPSEDGSLGARLSLPKVIWTPKKAQQVNRMNKQAYSYRNLLFLLRSGIEPGTFGYSDIAMTTTPSAHIDIALKAKIRENSRAKNVSQISLWPSTVTLLVGNSWRRILTDVK